MEINSERLTIRPFNEQDFEDTLELYQNKEVCKYLLHQPWQANDAEKLFEEKVNNNTLTEQQMLNLACELEGKVIGDVSVWYTGMKETVEVGFVFNPLYAGKGYASEAVKNVLANLFLDQNMHRVQAVLDARNIASAKLCERVGMRQEAHFIQDYWNKGEWTDSYVYAILKEEYLED